MSADESVRESAREQARDGLRGFARGLRSGAVGGLRRTAPAGVVSVLVAAACAPVIGALGGVAGAGVVEAALAQVGAVGAGYLAEAVIAARRRLIGDDAGDDADGREGPVADLDQDALVAALSDELEERLRRGGAAADGLRREMSDVLRAVDAVPALLEEGFDATREEIRDAVATALVEVGGWHEDFAWMLDELGTQIEAVRQQLTRIEESARQDGAVVRRSFVTLTLLRAELARLTGHLGSGAARASADGAAAADGPVRGPMPPAPGECPYPGLQSFRPEHTAWFRGREQLTATLVGRLAAGAAPLVVLGASGAGKSSLLMAGLLPALAGGALPFEGSQDWPWAVLTPGPHPLESLAAAVAAVGGFDAGALAAGLRRDPTRLRATALALTRQTGSLGAAVAPVTAVVGQSSPPRRLVVVVDQFEELFTVCRDETERQAFVDALEALWSVADAPAGASALVVLGVRADFYGQCARDPALRAALDGGPVLVGPMSDDELRAAVEKPATLAGWSLEPGLVEALRADLAGRPGKPYPPGALPLLAHALRETWRRRDGRRLTVAGYRSTGGIEGAVARTAEQVHDALDDDGRTVLRHLLTALVEDGAPGAGPARRRLPREDLLRFAGGAERATPVLDRVVSARLATASDGTVELSHEALLDAWPRLRDWLAEDADDRRERAAIEAAAAAWRRVGRDDGALLRGAALARAQPWWDEPERRDRLADTERALLAASLAARDRAALAVRRRTRRLGLLAAALAVLVVATSATTVAAVRSRNDAEQARRVAVSRQLAAQALAVRDADPRRAMLNAVASWRAAQTVEARSALLSLQAWPYAGLLRGASPDLDALAVSPDGRTVAVAGEGGRVELWPAGGRGRFRVLDGVVPDVRSVAFSADGTTVAAGGTVPSAAGPSVRWWDVATGAERGAMTVGQVAAVAFVPGTDRLAVSQQDRAVHVWDLARRAELWRTDPADGFVWALAPSPDGSLLAGPTDTGSVALWSLADGKDVATLRGHEGRASAVAFSADGTTLASAGSDGTVRRWDVGTRTAAGPVLRVPEPTPLTSVAVSADGSHVVAVGGRAVWQWQAATGARLGSLFPGADLLQAAAFGPDGHTLYVASDDGSVSRWVIGRSVVRFTDVVYAVAFAPDGRRVAATAQDGTTRIWSAASGDVIRVLTGQPASDLAFSPDGTELAVAQSDGMLRRWDVSTGVERGAVDVSGAGAADVDAPRTPQGLAWSPDGSTVTAWTRARDIGTRPDPTPGTNDGAAVLVRWDVRSGRLLPALGVPGRDVRGVGYARGGTWLVTGLASPSQAAPVAESVRVWDAATGAVVADLAEPDVLLAATAADGRSVAVATVAGDVRIRTLVAGDEASAGAGAPRSTVRTIRVSPNRPVRYVALSPDGTLLAASVGDETALQLWDVRSGRRVASLDRHERRLERFAFSPDGRRLATTSDDGSVVVWTLDPSAVADDLCGRLAGPALAAEWRTVAETDQLGRDPCEG